ncbi:MAG: hypothetical protein PWP31_1605 [Clostridia bacterium]|nr:hypothetical protein [Clostridia bacterium]
MDEKNKKVAPGMEKALEREATEEEKRKGNTTRVTRFSWDEVEQ